MFIKFGRTNGMKLFWYLISFMKFYRKFQTNCNLFVIVPAGTPSRGGDVRVCVFDINQPSLPTPFILFLCLFLSYGPLTCISFHKFSRQLSVFSLCSPSLISASLVLSTVYLFLNVSLNGFGDPARLPCAATRVGGERDPGD